MEGRPLEDSELVNRARNGDVDAYEELVQRYQSIAHRVAWIVTRSEADAEDATQEAFVKAYRALGRFRADASFKPWLLKIVTNESRNRIRSRSRHAALETRVFEDRPSGGEAPSSEATVLAGLVRTELISAVNELSEGDRLVIAYRYFFELSEAETATAMGVARGTVKSRLSRALNRLRERMQEVPGSEVIDE